MVLLPIQGDYVVIEPGNFGGVYRVLFLVPLLFGDCAGCNWVIILFGVAKKRFEKLGAALNVRELNIDNSLDLETNVVDVAVI